MMKEESTEIVSPAAILEILETQPIAGGLWEVLARSERLLRDGDLSPKEATRLLAEVHRIKARMARETVREAYAKARKALRDAQGNVCAGSWQGPCRKRKKPPKYAFSPHMIRKRRGRAWRCKQCARITVSVFRSEAARKGAAARTPEERSEYARKGAAAITPEQRSENARKANAARTPEQRSEIGRKGAAARTPEQRSEIIRKAWITRRAKSSRG